MQPFVMFGKELALKPAERNHNCWHLCSERHYEVSFTWPKAKIPGCDVTDTESHSQKSHVYAGNKV